MLAVLEEIELQCRLRLGAWESSQLPPPGSDAHAEVNYDGVADHVDAAALAFRAARHRHLQEPKDALRVLCCL